MEFLCGSEDGTKPGMFPMKDGGDWILGLTECHGWEERLNGLMPMHRIVVGDQPPAGDPTAGVAIVLSPKLARARVDGGKVGSRTAWVQLETAIGGTDVIAVLSYVPHFGRRNPGPDDTYRELGQPFQEFDEIPRKRRAIKIFMGDFNGRLARAYNFTGKQREGVTHEQRTSEVTGCWSPHHSDNEMGGKLREFLQEHSLVSAGSFFRPKQKVGGAATYVPFGRNAARKAACLDYMCISRKWLSSVRDVQVKWAPSSQRWGEPAGVRKDHAMLEMTLALRVAKKKLQPKLRYTALRTPDGAECAAKAYAAAKLEHRGKLVIQHRHLQPRPDRQQGPLSFEELGIGVEGLAPGMAPLEPSPRSYLEPGGPDTTGGNAQFGLEAAVEMLELCSRAAMRDLPKAETVFERKRAAVSDRSIEIKQQQVEYRQRLAADTLAP